MRWTMLGVAALCVALAGCQDNEARNQNARLQAELEAIKAQNKGGSDDFMKVWLASQSKDGSADSDKRFNTLAEDVRAGFADLRKQIDDGRKDTDKKIDDLDGRIRKVSDLEASLTGLKSMIEALEGKVKNADSSEILKLHKDLITKEAELTVEKKAREAAEAQIAAFKAELDLAKSEISTLKAEMVGLKGEDISKHPMYTALKRENADLKAELERSRNDFDNLKKEYDELLKRVGAGPESPTPETPKASTEFAFTGSVTQLSKLRADDPQTLLVVDVKTGRVPPLNTELVVRDARGNEVCLVKVTKHYHVSENPDLPVDALGCTTVNERATRPVAKGDQVVWIEKKESGGGEPRSGSASGE